MAAEADFQRRAAQLGYPVPQIVADGFEGSAEGGRHFFTEHSLGEASLHDAALAGADAHGQVPQELLGVQDAVEAGDMLADLAELERPVAAAEVFPVDQPYPALVLVPQVVGAVSVRQSEDGRQRVHDEAVGAVEASQAAPAQGPIADQPSAVGIALQQLLQLNAGSGVILRAGHVPLDCLLQRGRELSRPRSRRCRPAP